MKKQKFYNPNAFNAKHAAIAFLLFWVAQIGVSFAYEAMEKRYYAVFGDSADAVPMYCLNSVMVAVSLLMIVFIVSQIAHSNPFNGGGFLMRKGQGTLLLVAAVGICGLSVLFMPLADSFSSNFQFLQDFIFGKQSEVSEEYLQGSGWLLLYLFICVPILPAIFEELLFRGVIMRGLMQFGKTAAIILSAALFALAHGNFNQLVYQFLCGLAIGYIAMETKSIFAGMVMHFSNNLFAVAISLMTGTVSLRSQAKGYLAIMEIMMIFIGLICLISSIVYFGKRAVYTRMHKEQTNTSYNANFIVSDEVLGTVEEKKSWSETGMLVSAEEERIFTTNGKSRYRLNKKSAFLSTTILLAIGAVVGIIMQIIYFVSPLFL